MRRLQATAAGYQLMRILAAINRFWFADHREQSFRVPEWPNTSSTGTRRSGVWDASLQEEAIDHPSS
jgi:hypothetical protein